MIEITHRISQHNELLLAFKRLPLTLRRSVAEAVTNRAADILKAAAAANAPKGTRARRVKRRRIEPGGLKAGIFAARVPHPVWPVYYIIGTDKAVWYGRLIETGWKATGRRPRGTRWSVHRSEARKAAARTVAARPWLKPALEQNYARIVALYESACREALSREGFHVR